MARSSTPRNPERGNTIVLLALFIVILFAFAALAIDVGVLFTARTSAQNAADAAALAGVFTFLNPCTSASPPIGCSGSLPTQPVAARSAAIATAAKNKVMGKFVTLSDVFTSCASLPTSFSAGSEGAVCVDVPNRRVTVAVARQGGHGIATFFARVISHSLVGVKVHATAEAGVGATGAACVKPVFLPNTFLSTDPNACNTTPPEIIFDPANNNQVTPWAAAQLGNCANIRPTHGGDNGNLPAPGQFYALDFASGPLTYSCTWSNCLNTPVCAADITAIKCGHPYPVKTGNTSPGQTQSGVNGLIGNPPTDTWLSVDKFSTPQGVSTTSRALVVAPVWNNCPPTGQPIIGWTSGQTATPIGFVQVFVDSFSDTLQPACLLGGTPANDIGGNNEWMQAHVVNEISCGDSTGSISGATATGPYGVPIRLVKTP